MSAERWTECLEAFREETAYRASDARELRARVLRGFDVRRPRPRAVPWLIPVVAVLVGAGALAATSTRHALSLKELVAYLQAPDSAPKLRPLPRTLTRATPPASPETVPAEPRSTEGTSLVPTSPVPSSPGTSSSGAKQAVAIVELDDLPTDGITARGPESGRTAHRGGPPATAATVETAIPRELALYRTAHDLYFNGGSPARAAAAFQTYLDAYPNGALSLEARFNLGACFARLGNRAHALRWLGPFAEGRHGDYMRRAADDLLAALR
jgi:hypothetical protein